MATDPGAEIRRLRIAMRDLVALSTIPAAWVGREPLAIARGLADVLIDNPDQIFESFVTTKPHGTGMGLPITRSIVESHGGRLWANANARPGATFLFTLPSETGAQRPSQQR